MRLAIRESMSKALIIDLHGSSAKKEVCPDGSKDENVFDIQQGVSISLWVRRSALAQLAEVSHADLWGEREAKLAWLSRQSVANTTFSSLTPEDPYHFFVPKNLELRREYESGVSLTDAFIVSGSGVKTDRDALFFGDSQDQVAKRVKLLLSPSGLCEPFVSDYRVENSSSYPLLERRVACHYEPGAIHRCLYRPFDERWLYYSVGLTVTGHFKTGHSGSL